MIKDRRRAIADILRQYRICTQEDLVTLLSERGYSVTQATISRDMREMGLVKIPDDEDGYRYVLPDDGRSLSKEEHIIREFVVGAEGSGNLIVIKTMPGAAQGVGAAFDMLCWSEVMGTIAGDDTIFIALRTLEDLRALLDRIKDLLEEY